MTIHGEGSVRSNQKGFRFIFCKTGPNCRPQTVAHGSESPGGKESSWLLKAIILRCPHLVLSNIGSNNRLILHKLSYRIQDILGMKSILLGVLHDLIRLYFFPPLRILSFLNLWKNRLHPFFDIGLHRAIGSQILSQFSFINIHMDNLAILRVSGKIARCSIGETYADCNHQVTFRLHLGCLIAAMHSHKTKTQRMRIRKCRPPHHTYGNRGI